MALIELKLNPSRRELRWFAGVWFPAFFALLGAGVLHMSGSLSIAASIWIPALLVTGIALLRPRFARVVYVGWLYAVYPIGWTISSLVLAAVYYGVITPIGLVLRATRGDALQLRRYPAAESYWVRRPPDDDTERYFRQS